MNNYRKVGKLNKTVAAYIAGVVDGEGTVTLTRHHKDKPRHLAVSVSNCELLLLEYIKLRIGAGKITKKRSYRQHHSPAFTYQILNRQALALLTQIYPYMRTYKKRRTTVILDNYIKLTPRNGKYTFTMWQDREKFVEEVLSIKP